MLAPKVGIWFVGAWGGVATTATVGLLALQKGLSGTSGLVTERPEFANLKLIDWQQLVVGGHDIRETTYWASAQELWEKSRVFSPPLLEAIKSDLALFDQNVRQGSLKNAGKTITSLASQPTVEQSAPETAIEAIQRLSADMIEFKARHQLQSVLVVNVASTEPPIDASLRDLSLGQLDAGLAKNSLALPPSCLYAIAAIQAGFAHINFTPSVGTDIPSITEMAERARVLHTGRDGKTGETLMKSVLAPMFAARNLMVQSWVGHNIFGNMDGKVLDDPVNKSNKVRSKDHLLQEILGYKPQTLVSIEYIESMGDWKTAWDHIHFEGFLGTKMMLQFTWQGCDSLLAAPLVLDLVRLVERESRRGKFGLATFLASFFKSPMGSDQPEFAKQFWQLQQWVNDVREG